jgi:hypothetical protein
MAQSKFTLYKYVKMSDGSWRYKKAAFHSNGKFGIATLRGVPIGTVSRNPAEYSFQMRMGEMAPRLLLVVACPICGAAAGKRCLLQSGRPSSEPHIDRKLCAIEAVESRECSAGRFKL